MVLPLPERPTIATVSPGRTVKADVVQHPALVAAVVERHVAEFDLAARARRAAVAALPSVGWSRSSNTLWPAAMPCCSGPLMLHQAAQRRGDEHQRRQKAEKSSTCMSCANTWRMATYSTPPAPWRRCSCTTGLLTALARASFMFEARLCSLTCSKRSL